MPAIDFTRRTALYRLFDAADNLLYVGIAFDPEARWRYHDGSAAWWPLVVRKDVAWFDTRTRALEAEGRAIEFEAPLYNVRGALHSPALPRIVKPSMTPNRVVRIDDETWAAYARVCEARGISRADAIRLSIKREIAEFEREQRRIAREEGAAVTPG